MNTKQVIVMRTDLNMRKGKMCAQAAHASLGIILSQMTKTKQGKDYSWACYQLFAHENDAFEHWIQAGQKKIVVGVDSEEALLALYNAAKMKSLPVHLVTDSGLTEFKGIPTNTCIAIGPTESNKVDELTGNLKLL